MTSPPIALQMLPESALFRHGRAFAISSGAVEPIKDCMEELMAFAESTSEASTPECYDTKRFPDDALRESRYEKNCVSIKEAQVRSKHASARAGELDEKAMRLRAAVGSKPGHPWACYFCAYGAIAL